MSYVRLGRPPQNGINNHNFKHGGKGTRIYNIWKDMRKRCNNPNSANYKNYGGRGITVCNEWDDFLNFKDWSYNNGYSDLLSLDRIDNSSGYNPNNCRWADRFTQNNNTRKNKLYHVNGEMLTVSQLSRKYNINVQTLRSRINTGKNIIEALNI